MGFDHLIFGHVGGKFVDTVDHQTKKDDADNCVREQETSAGIIR
jgi:hypothetical protein